MGIESTMAALTVALDKHTAALEAFVKAGAGKGAAGGTTAGKTETKTESAGTKPAGGKGTKPKKITQEMVADKFGGFLKVGDKAERTARLETVKKINAHFGVPKMTEADESIWPDAFAILDRVIADEDIDDILAELGDGEEGDGEDDGESVV